MASQSMQPYELEGHAFDFVDGLPIRKRLRASTTLVPDAQAELPRVEADKIHPPGKTACGGRLIFETPSEACLSQTESPLLRLAQLTKATLLQAAGQESSPAVIKAIKCVSEQCVEAISAATQELPGDVDVAAVEQAAVERVLQHQQRLQHTQEQLRQQEAQIQSLSDDLTSLEQLTQSAGQQLSADAGAIGKTADQKSRSEVQVKVLAHVLEYIDRLKNKAEAASRDMEIWFRDKISRKLPNTHDPIKAFGMLE